MEPVLNGDPVAFVKHQLDLDQLITGAAGPARGSTGWADVTGATFPNVTTGTAAHLLTFARTQRYVRCVVTISGGSPSAAVCAAVGQQKKVI